MATYTAPAHHCFLRAWLLTQLDGMGLNIHAHMVHVKPLSDSCVLDWKIHARPVGTGIAPSPPRTAIPSVESLTCKPLSYLL